VLRICILEDYPPLSRVLAVTLQRIGCHVTLSQSACAVLQGVEQCAYDVLLVDMDRAHAERWRVLRHLATAPYAPPIVILLSPGHGEGQDLDAYGVHAVLLKPVSREALLHGLMLVLPSQRRAL
jgi:CheY-like chemotaxis protein